MKQLRHWIRLKGLVAFVVLALAFLGLWYVFVDNLIKYSIEKLGTRALGAKVELEKADLTLYPLGISLVGLKATNPDKPMENAVEIGKACFTIDTSNLFLHRTIIDDMSLETVRLGTPRKTSGAISRHRKVRKAAAKKEKRHGLVTTLLPGHGFLKPPSVEQILENENLETTALIHSIESDIAKEKKLWKERLKSLPSHKKIEEYRKRIKRIQSSTKNGNINNILANLQEIQALKQDIIHDISNTRRTLTAFDKDYTRLKSRTVELNRAISSDATRLSKKYSLSAQGLSHVTQTLIGPKVYTWGAWCIKWYKRLQPLLQRNKRHENGVELVKPVRINGIDVHFKENNPLPDFLIRHASVSVNTSAGTVAGEIRDITPDQDILGRPLVFTFTGRQLRGVNSVRLHGVLDHISPANTSDRMDFSLKGLQIRGMALSDSKDLPVIIKTGLIDMKGRVSLKGERLEANVIARLSSARIETTGSSKGSFLQQAICSSLSSIKGFWVKINLKGTLNNYKTSISSNLDKVLASSIRNAAANQFQLLRKNLYSAIINRTGGQIQEINTGLKDMLGTRSIITQRMGNLTAILNGMPQGTINNGNLLPFQR